MKINKSAKVVRDGEIIYVCVSHCIVLENGILGPRSSWAPYGVVLSTVLPHAP